MTFIAYETVFGDRWDLIAQRMYGDATKFAGIIGANPQLLVDPVLPLGILLSVPVIQPTVAVVPSPPWSLSRSA